MPLPPKVTIREVGPREGFQTITTPVPTDRKIELIDALSVTGVTSIEITSFVRPDRVPQMADAEQVVAGYGRRPGVRYTVLYLNSNGFERAVACGNRVDLEAWLPFSVSEQFLQRNSNVTMDGFVERIPAWTELFKAAGLGNVQLMVSTAFGYHDETVSVADAVHSIGRVADAVTASGLKLAEICLADTVGLANPEQVRRTVDGVRTRFSSAEVSLHLHDTRGSGMANVYAGLLEGISIFDTSIGGLGGCPFATGAAGNVPTEDVVYLCESLGIETGCSLERLVDAAKVAEAVTGSPLRARYSSIGRRGAV